MKDLDYENLFIYMSLIFAFCIFIILLYGCAFANTTQSGGRSSQIYEGFLNEDDKGDVKSQVLAILTDAETKDTTSAENKTKITDAIDKINNNNISVAELKKIIDLLKDMTPKAITSKALNKTTPTTPATTPTTPATTPATPATPATTPTTAATTPTIAATTSTDTVSAPLSAP